MPGRGIRLLPVLRYRIVALEVLSSRLRVPHEVASLAAVEALFEHRCLVSSIDPTQLRVLI
jgi:hypothetical protein